MLLVVNVGNTNTHFGIFQGKRLLKAFDLPTPASAFKPEWKQRLKVILSHWEKRGTWEGVMAATVVPRVRLKLTEILRLLTNKKVQWVTSITPSPVKNAYHPPKSLGVDRLLNAIAACAEFGAPVVILDAGTAFHVDAVDAQGTFLGGAIWPGLDRSAACLAQSTALLPRVALKKPVSCLGRTTRQGLQAGIILGSSGAVNALIAGLRRIVGSRAVVVGTGGGIKPGALEIPSLQYIRPHLALFGLQRLWQARLK